MEFKERITKYTNDKNNEDIERMTEEETQEYIGLQKSISSQSISQYLDIMQKDKNEDTNNNTQEGSFNE